MIHLVASYLVNGQCSMIKTGIIKNTSYLYLRNCIAAFKFITDLIFDIIISLDSAISIPNNSSIVLVKYYFSSIILTIFVTYYIILNVDFCVDYQAGFPNDNYRDLSQRPADSHFKAAWNQLIRALQFKKHQ